MKSSAPRLAWLIGLGLVTVIVLGCRTARRPAPDETRPPPQPFRLDYVDADAFDLLLETTLINAMPVIVVQTAHDKPDWGPRLNAWIAAWNAGRIAPFRARGQIPVVPQVVVDGDSIREFRFLIDGLMGRVEESARAGTQWWAERHMRDRRIALLRPYNLRFHLDADGRIQLIFFHGGHAVHYADVVRSLAGPAAADALEWSPGYVCSQTEPGGPRTGGRTSLARPAGQGGSPVSP
jgi:hypothetical protein